MNIRLDAKTRKLISNVVASGACRSADDAVRQGLILLK